MTLLRRLLLGGALALVPGACRRPGCRGRGDAGAGDGRRVRRRRRRRLGDVLESRGAGDRVGVLGGGRSGARGLRGGARRRRQSAHVRLRRAGQHPRGARHLAGRGDLLPARRRDRPRGRPGHRGAERRLGGGVAAPHHHACGRQPPALPRVGAARRGHAEVRPWQCGAGGAHAGARRPPGRRPRPRHPRQQPVRRRCRGDGRPPQGEAGAHRPQPVRAGVRDRPGRRRACSSPGRCGRAWRSGRPRR